MDTDVNADSPLDYPGRHAASSGRDGGARDAARSELDRFLTPASFLISRHVDLFTVPPWMEHGPFAFWLIDALRPASFVELGTHTGFSYFSFCQAVRDFRLPTRCYAVDTWKGDDHAGFYDEDVFERVSAINADCYSGFSELIRARFDEAVVCFAAGEIDLLHIDGRHGYEDVKADFESWRPKLSSRGVVLFHDTSIKTNGFGVWRLWQELSASYPSFRFTHGNGLGVLAVGAHVHPTLLALCEAPPPVHAAVRDAYSRLGQAITHQREALSLRAETETLRERTGELELEAAATTADLDRVRAELTSADAERTQRGVENARRIEQMARQAAEAERRLAEANAAASAAGHRAASAEAERGSLQRAVSGLETRVASAEAERDAIRCSTIWRATRPVRTVLGSESLRPIRTGLRRALRATYWTATLQFPRRYAAWRRTQALAPPTAAPSLPSLSSLAAAIVPAWPSAPDYSPTAWFAAYRNGVDYGKIKWHGSLRFSIIMPVYKVRAQWLRDAIASVVRQTNPNWDLICVDDHSQDTLLSEILQSAARSHDRIRVITLDENQGAAAATNAGLARATGDYILFMDHDDLLEPHALARLGDAASLEESDILYADEVVTGENPDEILGIQVRPAFSHTYYLSHPYFVHPVAVRASLARQVGGLDPSLRISQDVDFVLRALEQAQRVTHVPDILYRWRTTSDSAGHQRMNEVTATTSRLKIAHLHRIGFPDAQVTGGTSFNTFAVRYFGSHTDRILAIIPTKNQGHLLRVCIETVRATSSSLRLDFVVVDHQSSDPDTIAYLRELESSGAARVVPFEGEFNYSAINNHAVQAAGAGYDHFLFLNNDIEAQTPGWLEAMVDLATRADVGAVGATLLYPDGVVQHSGVIVGLHGVAEHAFKTLPYSAGDAGFGGSLHSTREYSAVTAACMLVPAAVFHEVGGYDPKLAVGFNDTDLCLRIGRKGYRVVNCAEAVLLHHESASRGKSLDGQDPHPQDSAKFRHRHQAFFRESDPHFSPLLAMDNPTFVMDFAARVALYIQYATATDFLPKGKRTPE